MQFSHQRARQKLCSPLCSQLGLNLVPVGAKWKQLSESNFQRHLRLQVLFASDAPELQQEAEPLGGDAWGSEPLHPSSAVGQPLDGHVIFYNWAQGPLSWKGSPGEVFHLPSHPFLLARLSGIKPWSSDSVTLVRDGFADFKHKASTGSHLWIWSLVSTAENGILNAKKKKKNRAKIENRNV